MASFATTDLVVVICAFRRPRRYPTLLQASRRDRIQDIAALGILSRARRERSPIEATEAASVAVAILNLRPHRSMLPQSCFHIT
jgi:hypothetical protein